jgi:predicted MFS family arabinose efflux permease
MGEPTASADRGPGDEFRANWVRLFGCSVGAGCGLGLYTPVASIFFRTLEHQFHWSKAASAASFLAYPVTALCLPLVGRLLDRLGAPIVVSSSILGLSGCLLGLSLMSGGLAQFYILFLATSLVGAGTTPISYTRITAEDFQKARGLALSLTLVGSAAISAVAPILISAAITTHGWRSGYRMLALITLGGGLFAMLLIGFPRRAGMRQGALGLTGLSLGGALHTRAFWSLSIALLLLGTAGIGFFSQIQSIVVEKGLSPAEGALMASLLAAALIPSRIIVGWALDVVDPRRAGAVAILFSAGGAMLMIATPEGSLGLVCLAVVLMSASIGAEADLMSFFCVQCFGLRHYASVYGVVIGFFYLGSAIGGIGYGAVHDLTGGYAGALAGASVLLGVASALILTLPASAPVRELSA